MKPKKPFTLEQWAAICVIATMLIAGITLLPTAWGWNRFLLRVTDLPDSFDRISARLEDLEKRQTLSEAREDRTDKNVRAIARHFSIPTVSEESPVGSTPPPKPGDQLPTLWATVPDRRIVASLRNDGEND